jgi:hypothetical protein
LTTLDYIAHAFLVQYAYSKAPDRLKGFIMATYLLTVAVGDLLGGILYSGIFRQMDRAVVMYVCACLMLFNRFIFGRVVAATRQDSARSGNTASPGVAQAESHEPYSDQTDDNPAASETAATMARHSFDGSMEMVGEGSRVAGKSLGNNSCLGGGSVDDEWMNLEMPKIQIV